MASVVAGLGVIASALVACSPVADADGEQIQDSAFEVYGADATALGEALSEGRITSVQLVSDYLQRIAAYEYPYGDQPGVNAITNLDPSALAQAEALDTERAAGEVRGPLHGIPVIIKDVVDVEGLPTTGSLEALRDLMPEDDATQVTKLREAGAIILAKSNVMEVNGRGAGTFGGDSRNPFDQSRHPGFSSGGASAGVAAGFAPLALAEDTFGSIRIPAALSNLVGIRPTTGLSSADGLQRLSWTYDTLGPVTRTVRDAAVMLDATVGFDANDPTSIEDASLPEGGYAAQLSTEALQGKRIGVLDELFATGNADQSSTSDVVREAINDLEAQGASVVPVELPTELWDENNAIGMNIILYELADALSDYLADDTVGADAVAALAAPEATLTRADLLAFAGALDPDDGKAVAAADGPVVSTTEYNKALAAAERYTTALTRFLDDNDLDVVAYPSMQQPASALGTSDSFEQEKLAANAGFPAISVPAGFVDGLPVGLELMARPFSEADLLAMAYAFEQSGDRSVLAPTTPPLS